MITLLENVSEHFSIIITQFNLYLYFYIIFFFLDIATVVGFYAVSIPFMNSKSYLSNLPQNERFRVSKIMYKQNIKIQII